MNRQRVAEVLNEIALYLALKGESPFKIRAYENGARIIQTLDEELETLIQEKRLGTVEGIGKALEQKITELVLTGDLEYLKELKAEFPPGLFELLRYRAWGQKESGYYMTPLALHPSASWNTPVTKTGWQLCRDSEGRPRKTLKKAYLLFVPLPAGICCMKQGVWHFPC